MTFPIKKLVAGWSYILHLFLPNMGSGIGTKSHAELFALWGILKFALIEKIQVIQFSGDSRVMVDWANGSSSLQTILLEN